MTVRWGGEEFLVYLPRTSKEKAVLIAERLRHNTAAEPVEGILVTISLGVAEGILNQELIQKADEALITAKQSGRNRVVID
jgi:diguanylate cyclase (GGDEF)-like protein